MKTYCLHVLPVALLGTAMAPSLVSAQELEVGRIAITYADLDLSSASGVARLDNRIRDAVETACGSVSAVDHAGKNAARNCRSEALALARAHRDTVVARYNETRKTELSSRD